MEFFITTVLNGLSYGLMLFMLSAGLTLTFSMMGVLNFAHASFYMLGAYLGFSIAQTWGFWAALVLAPLAVGVLGALFERLCLRRVHALGHVPELLVTFGLSYIVLEIVQLVWGRSALDFSPPASLQGAAFTLVHRAGEGLSVVLGAPPNAVCSNLADAALRVSCSPFPATRALMVVVALLMLALIAALLTRTRTGLVVRAALTHPEMVNSLGHDLPRLYMLLFGAGTALAALAGGVGGSTYLPDPAMAASMGAMVFVVVVVGGLGSLSGAFAASLLIGLLQTAAAAADVSVLPGVTLARLAPALPFVLMLLMLVLRPQGLLGRPPA
jgi:branched-chain amino acid transport system permease protein